MCTNLKRFRDTVTRRKRMIEELIVDAGRNEQIMLEEFKFKEAEKFRKVIDFLQKSANELFMASVCLMDD